MRALAIFSAVIAAMPVAALAVGDENDEPILGTFEPDPVLLIRDGEETAGREDLTVRHASFRYRFASESTRDAFLAEPSRYEIRLGGACGRMGALSGTGRTDLFAVHDGGLYLFASEACRATFRRDPARVLEPLEDPETPADAKALARGEALVDRAVAWLGGAARLDGAVIRIRRDRTVEHDGTGHRSMSEVLLAPGGRMRDESAWDDREWVRVLTPGDAFLVDPDTGARTLRPAQRRALERRHYRHLLPLLRARHEPGFRAAAPGPPHEAPVLVHVRHAGIEHALAIDPETGRITTHAYTGHGPDRTVGRVERTYTEWEVRKGLSIPSAWNVRFDGEEVEPVHRLAEGYAIDVLDAVPNDAFDRPS